MWPIQLASLLIIVRRKLLSSLVLHIHMHKFHVGIISFQHGVGDCVCSGTWTTLGIWKEVHPRTGHEDPEGE
jgi:hypothetical protein